MAAKGKSRGARPATHGRHRPAGRSPSTQRPTTGRPSALIDTRVIYCGDCIDRLRNLPDACVDLIYIDPPFNSNRNYEVFWSDSSEPRPPALYVAQRCQGLGSRLLPLFEDRHASTAAYIDHMRPRCVELARVLKKSGSFYYHYDWQDATSWATLTNCWS